MSFYLAYSYSISLGLSKEEEIEIDKQASRSRELIFGFITKFLLNIKQKD